MTFIQRRKYLRHECELTVQVRLEGESDVLTATVADICLGGCYVSTISPPSAGTLVSLSFEGEGPSATIAGRTVTSMPGNGMGIEFIETMTPDNAAWLKSLIERLDGNKEKVVAAR
jgi:hypothetical protein